MKEPFQRGESVTLRDAATPTLGRIVSVNVEWHRRTGHDHEITSEDTITLRRAHESELFE